MADNFDEEEVRFLSSNSVVNRFGGEDLCERANIYRRNGYNRETVALDNYNEGFVDMMVNKEPVDKTNKEMGDYEIESIVKSIIIDQKDGENSSSSDPKTDEEIEQLLDESEIIGDWTPNVFMKPNEEQFSEFTESAVNGYSITDLEDSLFSCLSFHTVSVVPYQSAQKAFSFHKSFLDRLKRLQCRDVKIQLFLWPSIVKNVSITCISGPQTGKTNSYLVPLVNWFDSRETHDKRDEVKIGAIVLCSSTRQTYNIARQARQWMDPTVPQMEQTIRIVVMNKTNERRQYTSILNGCDILITTPGPLLRAIESSLIDCLTTKSLIIDEGDRTLALHGKTIREIYLSYARMKKNNKRFVQKNGTVSNPMAFQTMIFADKWTEDVQWFSREVQHLPTIVFGSYYELSIAMKVECKVEVIENEKFREKTIKTLAKKAIEEKIKRIAIVCRNDDEISFLKRHMKEEMASVSTIEVSHKTPHYELEAKRNKWNRYGGLLFITERAIKIVSGFQMCYSIIHYKLPYNFGADFGDRFRLLTKQFKKCKNPFETAKLPKLVNYVVVSPEDSRYVTDLITYLNRLEAVIPKTLYSLSDYQRRTLCHHFSCFAKCPFGPIYCPDRHQFNEFDRPLPELPQNGQIKMVLTYVLSANQFYFRLQEFRNENHSSGQWHKRQFTYEDIRPELNALKDNAFNTVQNVCTETVYGIAIRAQVLRVRVLRLLREEDLQFYEEYDPNDKSQKIEVFCIDFGHKLRSRARQLFELPDKLKRLPSFAFKGYLFGIKPGDNEIDWDFTATQQFYNLVENFRVIHITAWIVKQIDGVFWLNRISVEKRLKNAKLSLESNPMKYLLENKFVEQNEASLPDVNTDYFSIINKWHNYRLSTSAFNAFLVNDTNYVFITDFESLEGFYVINDSSFDRLQELEKEWLSYLPSLEPLIEVTDNHICFFKGTDSFYNEDYLNRAKVVKIDGHSYDVFLVDNGEIITNVEKQSLFRISSDQLKQLPFQVIKVALFGVREVKKITHEVICGLTRDQSNCYLKTIARKQSFDNGVHTIRLFVSQDPSSTHFVALSKLLVDSNYAEYVDGEENNESEIFVYKKVDNPNEDIESDSMIRMEEEMRDNMNETIFKSILDKCGLDHTFFDQPSEQNRPKPVAESRASKTLRRLRAIKIKEQNEEPTDSSDSDDESNRFTKNIIPNSGEYDYEIDPNVEYLGYDPADLSDNEGQFSDEDGILNEEELT